MTYIWSDDRNLADIKSNILIDPSRDNGKQNENPVQQKKKLRSEPEVIKLFSCSTPLRTKFQLLIKTKMLRKIKTFLAYKRSYILFIMLIIVKMPTIVGILTFMSMINFMLS